MKKILTLILMLAFGSATMSAQANFSSQASGDWSTAATWTITSGTDADGIPDGVQGLRPVNTDGIRSRVP